MILSTTPTLEGRPIRQYHGVVTSEVIIGANFVRDIAASVRDFFGGRSQSHDTLLLEAKQPALRELDRRASQMGANAVVGIDLDYETIGASGSMLMVTACGTAVSI